MSNKINKNALRASEAALEAALGTAYIFEECAAEDHPGVGTVRIEQYIRDLEKARDSGADLHEEATTHDEDPEETQGPTIKPLSGGTDKGGG